MVDKTFFFPNCCHIYKRWDVKLISCAKCRMISYCNEAHQQQHWPRHKQICAAIRIVLEHKLYMNMEEISTDEWEKIQIKYKNEVSVILQRGLKLEEFEMFQFPKACVVCHRQDTTIRCNNCPSTAFCDKHREKVDTSCTKLLSNKTFFYNMESFLDIYIPLDKSNVYLRMLHSDRNTHPLTLYFCIKELDRLGCQTLNIHILGSYVINISEEMEVWKMLLILISTLTTLQITFIQGGNLFSERNTSEVVKVSETKKLVAKVRYMSYNEYIGTTAFKKPNLIVGFHATVVGDNFPTHVGLDISAFVDRNCSLILIFDYLRPRVEQIHNINKIFFGENPFLNLLPYRHFPTERICYINNYIIIFNVLGSSRVFVTENKCYLLPK